MHVLPHVCGGCVERHLSELRRQFRTPPEEEDDDMNSLNSPRVRGTLDRLFAEAVRDENRGPRWPAGISAERATALERAHAMSHIYMPVSREGGNLLYSFVRSIRPATVVEFGTSFAISTIFLAAAVADNGTGTVITTELDDSKIVAARANLKEPVSTGT
jgi:hypothetical protein